MPVYTVCFCGTACSRDEGEVDRDWRYKGVERVKHKKTERVSSLAIYDPDTGYIPVRIHMDISAVNAAARQDAPALRITTPSVTVRGVGENDWAEQVGSSEPLCGFGPTKGVLKIAGSDLAEYVTEYSNGSDRRSTVGQITGFADAALALHGANLAGLAAYKAAGGPVTAFNFLGHSRGGVESIMAAWFLYAYGGVELASIPVNIFAIDPVPGPGEWYGIFTQLPPNVRNYVGVYAWDHLDSGFMPVVPRPNAGMTGAREHAEVDKKPLGKSWLTLADNRQLTNPLKPSELAQPVGYSLYASRGRHGTVAGNTTSNGLYDPKDVSMNAGMVGKLVYKVARAYLTRWGTVFQTRCRVREDAKTLRRKIHSYHAEFDAMAGGETRHPWVDPMRGLVRRASSARGKYNILNKYVLEDVVGDPPFRLFYPCTSDRKGKGWVKWSFL